MPDKVKISITVSRDLLERVDAEAARDPKATRSGVIERWLRRAGRSRAEAVLREETVRYYESLAADERAEETAIARAASKRARRVRYD